MKKAFKRASFLISKNTFTLGMVLKVVITNEGINHMQNVHDNWEKVMDEIPISYAKLSPFSKCNYKGILKGEW